MVGTIAVFGAGVEAIGGTIVGAGVEVIGGTVAEAGAKAIGGTVAEAGAVGGGIGVGAGVAIAVAGRVTEVDAVVFIDSFFLFNPFFFNSVA